MCRWNLLQCVGDGLCAGCRLLQPALRGRHLRLHSERLADTLRQLRVLQSMVRGQPLLPGACSELHRKQRLL
jgi:hypothetical protein